MSCYGLTQQVSSQPPAVSRERIRLEGARGYIGYRNPAPPSISSGVEKIPLRLVERSTNGEVVSVQYGDAFGFVQHLAPAWARWDRPATTGESRAAPAASGNHNNDRELARRQLIAKLFGYMTNNMW